MTGSPKIPRSSKAAELLLEIDALRDEKCLKGPIGVEEATSVPWDTRLPTRPALAHHPQIGPSNA